jgi:hypothetical protein
MRGLRACSKAGENLQRRRKLNSLEVRIIRNDALKVKSLARQYALLIGRRNLKISWKLKIEWGGGVPCADAPGTTIITASAASPAVESNESLSEHFMRLTVPPCYFRFAVFREVNKEHSEYNSIPRTSFLVVMLFALRSR